MQEKNPFDALLQISNQLNSMHEINNLLEKVMDLAMDALKSERGFILLITQGKKTNFEVVTARKISKESISDIPSLSKSAVTYVLEKGEPVLSYDALEDKRFVGAKSIQIEKIHSIACVPLKVEDEIIGAIYMDNRSGVGKFNKESLNFLTTFAQQASVAINNAQVYKGLQAENAILRERVKNSLPFPEIVGESKEIYKVFDTIQRIANSEATVLIEGESGTGKELVARAIHNYSARRSKPFIPIFCGSLSETLLESELFGHKKGSFTGAIENKTGLFEEANGGTFFLDEIGDVSKNLQAKLLRVLQEGEIKRVGDNRIYKIDIRIIAATNKNMLDLVKNDKFREDLFYRLNVINMVMPSLRDRKEDVTLLAEHFLKIYSDKNKKNMKGISQKVMNELSHYDWPGNIRELENTIERAVIMSKGQYIECEDLQLSDNRKESNDVGKSLKDFQKNFVLSTLKVYEGNRTKCAEVLNVSRRWLQYQLKQWGIDSENSGL
jgi:Nif-specific regulatory protein